MTRSERLLEQEAKAHARLVEQQARLARARAQRREDEKREQRKRYIHVGQMVDHVGLFVFTDAELAVLFAALHVIGAAPDPRAALAAFLGAQVGPSGMQEMATPI